MTQQITKPRRNRSILPLDEPIDISRAQMTQLMLESYKKASNSAEEIMCLKEVSRLNDLYDDKPQNLTLIHVEQNVKKLEVMTDEELLKLSGNDLAMFERNESVKALEGEFTEVKEEGDGDDKGARG